MRARLRSGAVLAVANWVGGALVFLLLAISARLLGPVDYGLLAALFAIVTVSFVVALGHQAAVARAIASGTAPPSRGSTWALASATGAIAALAVLILGPVLDAPAASGAAAAVAVLPLVVAADPQGRLQGAERFTALAGAVLLLATARLLGAIPGWWLGDAELVLLGSGVTSAAAAILLLRLVPGSGVRGSLGESGSAAVGIGGVLLIANLDLLLARGLLPAAEAGQYAAAALVARVAFWLPGFAVQLGLPEFADPVRRVSALRRTTLLTVGLGASVVLATTFFASIALEFIGGRRYENALPQLPWFAALGTALALLQVAVYARIARRAVRTGAALLVAAGSLALTAVAVVSDGETLVRLFLAGTVITAGLLLGREFSRAGLPPEPATDPVGS